MVRGYVTHPTQRNTSRGVSRAFGIDRGRTAPSSSTPRARGEARRLAAGTPISLAPFVSSNSISSNAIRSARGVARGRIGLTRGVFGSHRYARRRVAGTTVASGRLPTPSRSVVGTVQNPRREGSSFERSPDSRDDRSCRAPRVRHGVRLRRESRGALGVVVRRPAVRHERPLAVERSGARHDQERLAVSSSTTAHLEVRETYPGAIRGSGRERVRGERARVHRNFRKRCTRCSRARHPLSSGVRASAPPRLMGCR